MTPGTVSDDKLRYLNGDTPYDKGDVLICYYDETVPSNDPKLLTPLRRWEKKMGFVTAIRWRNVVLISIFHIIAFLSPLYIFNLQKLTLKTFLFELFCGQVGGFGVTAGAHRYWTHRSYEAKVPFQIILMFCYAVAGQNTIYEWVRDHRVHHKWSETSADPHDVRRGFFFSHVGWLMMKKHPHVIKEGKKIYLNDIINDPLIDIYTRHFLLFKTLCCFILPVLVPVWAWGEEWTISFLSNIVRYVLNLNFTWAVNSFAHIWGYRPYDEHIMPAENWGVAIVSMGEGWHNYHHTFPYDYKAAELSYFINSTTLIIDAFALIGWVYNRKQASSCTIYSALQTRQISSNIQKYDKPKTV